MKTRSYVFVAGLLISFIAALGILTSVSAAPAAPVDILITQPDGSVFTARQWGDEWLNGFETPTGYTIIQDKNDRWVYADLTLDGSLLPFIEDGSTIQVGDPVPAGLSVNLRPALSIPEDWLTSPPVFETRSAGNRPILVLLVSFSNRANTYPASHFQNIIFGNSGSVKDYYLKASFNQLNFVPAAETHGTANDGVVGWLNLGYDHPNTGDKLNNIANQKTVKDALIAADPYVNYAAFDTNGDGHISSDELNIVVVVAGFERSYSNHSPSVWAHRWNLNQVGPPTLDGVTIGEFYKNGGYSQVGEIHQDHPATFGIIAHELGHDIGWPDLYDTSGASDGVGNWDIMAGGAWNRTGSNPQGTSPALPNAWLKWYQGWITPTAVNGTLTGQSIPQAATNPTAFLLRPNPNGVDWRFYVKSGVGEFFLVENRQLTGYDQGLPGPGLLIWHIDESVTSTNDANANYNRPLVKLIQADGLEHLSDRSNNNRGDAGDPYPGSTNNRTFNLSSNPSSRLHNGQDSLVQVTNISNSAATMTADLTYSAGPTKPSAPTGVSASKGTFTDKVRISWNTSSGATYYQVFRHTSNNSSSASTLTSNHTASPYNDTSAVPGTTYYYWVKACNTAGCSGFSSSDTGYRASQITPPSPPTGVSASEGTFTDKVRVTWGGNPNSGNQGFLPMILSGAGSSGTPGTLREAPYFQVFRHTSNSTSGAVKIKDHHPISPFDDTSAVPGTTYYYWVKACNSAGCSGFSAFDSGYRASGATAPSPPTGVSASGGTYTDKVQVSWSASTGATTYQVFRHTSNNSASASTLTNNHSASPYNDTSAVPGTTYYYWVKACNSAGCSGFSASDTGWCSTTSGIANGDFEAGPDESWTEYSSHGEPIITQFEPGAAHSGVWAVWMGGLHDSVDRLSQSVTISASQPYLHFWYWISSDDKCNFDYARVKINNTTVKTYDLCSPNNTGAWNPAVLNLSAYSGSTATLVFEVTTNASLLSSFYLDDASLSASATAATSAPSQGGTLFDMSLTNRQLPGVKKNLSFIKRFLAKN